MSEELDFSPESKTQIIGNPSDLPLPDEYSEDPGNKTILNNKQKIIIVSIVAAVLVGLLGLIIGLILFSGRNSEDDLILENVFAAGIELSGMTVEEATNALHAATDNTFSREPMVITIYDDTLTLSPDDTKASVDVAAIAQAAYQYGRSGSHAENQQIRRNAHKRSYTIPLLPYLNLDLSWIRDTVDTYCADIDSVYSDPVIILEGERPVYGEAQTVNHQALRITLGTPLRRLDAEDLYNQILDSYSMNELMLAYETPDIIFPAGVDAQALFDQYCTPAQDAKLDTSTYSVSSEAYGYGFDVDLLQQLLNDAQFGEEVEIKFSFLEPNVLAQDITDSLFSQVLAECTSSSKSAETNRNKNLQRTCDAINNTVIKPGDTFSLIRTLGQITEKAGFSEAPICSINGSAMGGGISQVASALYYCALHADLGIMEHHNHPYTPDFIELGLDAYIDGSTMDLRIKNTTDAPIRIKASVSNQTVSITLEGSKPLGYTVAIRTEITGKALPTTTYQMLMADNRQGYNDGDVIVSGIEGYQVSGYKEKTDKTTGSLLSTESLSTIVYQKRDEIIARIGVLAEPEPPTEPTDPTTPTE